MDFAHFQAPGAAETPDFASTLSKITRQMVNDENAQVEEYIRDQMELRGLTEKDLACFVLEWYPLEITYDPKGSRLSATRYIRLRHLTDEELKERDIAQHGQHG